MEYPINKPMVFRYLANRATPLERQAVEEWLRKGGDTETFHQWLLEWETKSPQYVPDSETAYQSLLERIDSQETMASNLQKTVPLRRRFSFLNWPIAASVALLLCAAGWLLRKPLLYKTYATEYGQTSSFILNDGSHVTLNANSSLDVPRFGFETGVRTVHLRGEAEFSVRHTPTHQRFVVSTSDQFQIEVLGTEFTVFARPRGTKVALSKGKIRLDYRHGTTKKHVLMKPGELATLNTAGSLRVKHSPDSDALSAWKEHRFVFNNTSVAEICALFEENFGLIVRASDPEIAARTISGNFKAQSAEDLLEVLVEVLNLEIRKDNKTLLLLNPNQNPKS
ncbi:FecR family protein [Salmonirosea aquatica]|uniref:DUF4974 domain-containing protein n=1 Tax=Salmonirosea aquatica TaxID=2654236 RepID=A0A7C9FT04_9BACT|nr:DUF4974 domain-containing protein [Cytophagaceae bacterium SJW1-29]